MTHEEFANDVVHLHNIEWNIVPPPPPYIIKLGSTKSLDMESRSTLSSSPILLKFTNWMIA